MRIDSILFDMDGVLIDSEYAIRTCCIEALKPYGINASHEDFYEFTGMGEDRFIGGVAEKYGREYCIAMKTRAYEIYCERADELVIVYEGIREMLLTLKQKGYRMAIASSADLVKVTRNLECIKIDREIFDTILTGSDVVNKKPHPEIYLTAAEKLNRQPEHCIVVEDALSGITAAKSAGMLCIGVTSAFDEQTLKNQGADYVVDQTYNIIGVLDQLNQVS